MVERRTSILSSPLENLGLKFTSPQFAYKNSGFWDQIFRGELKPERCTLIQKKEETGIELEHIYMVMGV